MITRRAVVGAIGAAVAAPQVARAARGVDFDVIVIGAGAAGIAAARRLAQSKKTFAVLEGSDRFGGRCFTDLATFGRPYDQGAVWVHETEAFPVAKLAKEAELTVESKPPAPELRMPVYQRNQALPQSRPARESDLEEFYATLVACDRAIAAAATQDNDIPAAQALPPEVHDWGATMEFMLGSFIAGADLADMPAKEYAQFARPETMLRIREGVGTLMRRLALGTRIQFFSPVTRIDWGADVIEIETRGVRMTAQAVILTASTGMLAGDTIAFRPALPPRVVDAIKHLKPGSIERVAIEFGDTRWLPSDKLVFERADNGKTAAAYVNTLGAPLCLVQVGGKTCGELAGEGDAAFTAFAVDWLATHYGGDIRKAVKRTHVTHWKDDPFARGAYSFAGAQSSAARKVLAAPLNNRLWFAGEAAHESIWGTVAGAWEMGERAANAIVKGVG